MSGERDWRIAGKVDGRVRSAVEACTPASMNKLKLVGDPGQDSIYLKLVRKWMAAHQDEMLVKLAECTTRHVFEPESRLLTCIEAGLLDTVMGKGLIGRKDTALRFPPCASCENLHKIKQDAGQALRMEAEAMISAGRRDIDCREMSQTVQRVFEIPDVKELCYYKLKLDTSVFKGAPRSPHLEYLHHLACLSKQQDETVYKTFLNENCVYFDIEGPAATPWQVGVIN